jgi:hypothetical protein
MALMNRDDLNDPIKFNELTARQQDDVMNWIGMVFVARKTKNTTHTSYGYKHDYAEYRNRTAPNDGLGDHYLCNGAFKGAMLHAGFVPVDRDALNWTFRVSYTPMKEVTK